MRHAPCARAQMGEEADSLYIILQGNVSVEASFVELPAAQRAVDFPVNVSSSSGWCARQRPPCPLHGMIRQPAMVCRLRNLMPWHPRSCMMGAPVLQARSFCRAIAVAASVF
jgi:hypothetical protein